MTTPASRNFRRHGDYATAHPVDTGPDAWLLGRHRVATEQDKLHGWCCAGRRVTAWCCPDAALLAPLRAVESIVAAAIDER